jgi:hypothetical protein
MEELLFPVKADKMPRWQLYLVEDILFTWKSIVDR